MHRLWKFNVGTVSDIAFTEGYVVLSSENRLLCFDRGGFLWNRTVNTTFYRDPYGDVAITALDAVNPHIAIGTNFMDGKLYLFTMDGKLRWEHQFATTASLGWRPEDVTAVRVGKEIVCAGTEFMNEYIYVYTLNRKRVFQKRVRGKVKDFLLMDDRIVVGTDQYLYMISLKGRILHSVRLPVERLGKLRNALVVLSRRGVTLLSERDLTRTWEHSVENATIYCCGGELLIAAGEYLSCFSVDGELLWKRHFDEKIVCLYCDGSSYYIGVEGQIFILDDDAMKKVRVEGVPLGFGKKVVATKSGHEIVLYDYTE